MSLLEMTPAPSTIGVTRTIADAKAGSKGLLASVALVYIVLTCLHVVVVSEGPGWTSPLLIGDHLFDLLLAVTMLWFALALGRRVAWPLLGLSGDPLTERLAACGLGLGLLSFGVFCAGMLHLYYGVVCVVAVVALAVWLRDDLLDILENARTAVVRWRRADMPTAPTPVQRLTLLLLVLLLAVVTVQATLPPGTGSEIAWDGPAYHLAAPKIYMEVHQIVALPDIPLANAPAGEEILYLFGLYAGSDGLAKMLQMAFAVLLGLATFALARRLADPAAGWLAVFLLFTIGWLSFEAPTSNPDFASFFLVILGMTDGFTWIDRLAPRAAGRPLLAPPRNRVTLTYLAQEMLSGNLLLVRSGLLIGLGVSYKLVNVPAIPALLILVGLATLSRYRGTPSAAIMPALRNMVVFGVAASLALDPWLLKNACFFGHPLYPFGIQEGGQNPALAAPITASTSTLSGHLAWMWQNFRYVFWNAEGPLCLLLVLAPFVLTRTARWAILGVFVIGGILWVSYVPVYVGPRYQVPMIVLEAVLTAAVAQKLLRQIPIRFEVAELPLVGYVLVQALLMLLVEITQVNRDHGFDIALGRISRDSYLASHIRPYLAEEWANQHTPSGAVIVLVAVTRGFFLDHPHLNEWYMSRLHILEGSKQGRAMEFARWCRAGVSYAIFDHDGYNYEGDNYKYINEPSTASWPHAPGLHARVLYSADAVDVLAVSPCAAALAPVERTR